MKFGRLYREIVSALNAPKDSLRFRDYTNAINETIADMRVEYIQAGQGDEFVVTEMVWALIQDFEYPYLNSISLEHTLLRALPIGFSVRQSLFWKACEELLDDEQSWSEGDVVYKDNTAYEALDDIVDENTYNLTFEVCNVRNWALNNKLHYKERDVVFDGENYYRFTSDYVNDQGEDITSAPTEQLFWKRITNAFHEGRAVPFSQLRETILRDQINEHYPFSIKENKFYTTATETPITISYIPEWEWIEDLDAELVISDSFYQSVKIRCLQLLSQKLGIVLPQTETDGE